MELKFRAWHKENKEYWDVMSILFDDQELELYEWGRVGFNEVILEQYTGMKDKNGKEIYVGDIIEMPFSGTNFKIEYRKFEDIGCNGGEYSFYITGFMPVRMDGTVDSWGTCEIAYSTLVEEDVEVIGNIHEREEY